MLEQIKKSCALNIKSSRLMSFLSFSTMTLLILASVVIITILSVLPIIILGIGELGQGQRDIILTPRLDYFNTTHLSQVASVPVMPRIQNIVQFNNKQVKGWFMDFKIEKQNHLGKIGGDEPEGHNYIYVHEQNRLSVGQSIDLALSNSNLLEAIKNAVENGQISTLYKQKVIGQIQQLLQNRVTLKGNFKVRQIFDTASGKFGIGQVNNYIYMDINYAYQQMLNSTYDALKKNKGTSKLIKLINSPYFSLSHFASQATINFPDRIAVYSNPNYDQTFIKSNELVKNVLEKAGFFSLISELPIAANLSGLGYLGMFMGVMFKLIICSLFILSVLMMNNMFIMGIESKNFDFALLKVMGANRSFIIANILAGSLKYVAFSNLIAYPLAYVVLNIITGVFQDFFGYRHQIQPTLGALLGGILIGVLVPIIASVAPLWSVIKNDLAQNLNPLRNKTEATQIEVYIEGKEFPTGKLAFGLIAASYGLMIYYLLPRALINQNLGLLLSIFFIILQGLLLGLILLSFSVQYLLQKILAYVCLFWVETTDLIMTIKNLESHRFRNRRTALLYAFSVSFIIYLSVGLQIQLQTVYVQALKVRGSYIMIYDRDTSLDKEFYDKILNTVNGVQDWAYVTPFLEKVLSKDAKILMSDKARLNFQNCHIRGVSPNLINTFFYQKVSYFKSHVPYPYDPYSYLYSPQGQSTATVSRYQANRIGLLDGDDREFYINIYQKKNMRKMALNYSTIFDKRMGLMYTTLPIWQEMGVSFDMFKTLANIPESEQVRLEELKIKVTDMNRIKEIAEQIRQKNQGRNRVWDYTELKATIDKIDNILSIVTYILLIISLTISFFSLLTTNYINIINQTNQIATLLILGYEKVRITKVYIYQSFVMVLNACLIGLVVGYLTAVMIGLQREIFSQLPITIQIRGIPLLFMASLLSSLFSTYQPLKKIFSLTISQILNYAK